MAKKDELDLKKDQLAEELKNASMEEESLEDKEQENEKDKDKKNEKKESNNEKELEEANTRILRLQADFINFKKRTEREKAATINYALEGFVCDLLPILDNFKIAMESEGDKDDGFYNGIDLIYKQLIDTLKDNDVKEIKALGEKFDPNYHHAVIMEENDKYESGKIIEVLQTGYLLKEKVIRPAMVKVAK
ncbi:MAG TPA: nucleotide exchange factor GrpE [Tissierellaceae bacterium]|nr:nucleotide exchange factor GrpE [Tissierellaceae bacterium]